MEINQFNIEIGVFLRRLRLYSDRKMVKVNEKTHALLLDTIDCIDKLIANSEMDGADTNNNNVDFLFDLNEQHFDLRQYIMCRLCIVCKKNIILCKFLTKLFNILTILIGTNQCVQGRF